MQQTIVRTASDIPAASEAVLRETIKALTGKTVSGFECRAAVEVVAQNAILAARDAAGHLGVPRGARPEALTVAERCAKAAERGIDPAAQLPEDQDENTNPYPPGSLAHGLWIASRASTPIDRAAKPEAKPAGAPRAKRGSAFAVKATFAGASKPNPNSTRMAVLKFIQEQPEHTATIAQVEANFEGARGYVQKLLDKNHLVVVEPGSEQ